MTKITGNTYAASSFLKMAGAKFVPAADGEKAYWMADEAAMAKITHMTRPSYGKAAFNSLSALKYEVM